MGSGGVSVGRAVGVMVWVKVGRNVQVGRGVLVTVEVLVYVEVKGDVGVTVAVRTRSVEVGREREAGG